MPAADKLDPYAVLGVARNATDAEIRAAYLELVARYHPDKHQGNPLEALAAEKMAEINRAHDILSDPDRRVAYDRGHAGFHASAPSAPVGRARSSRATKIIALILVLPLLLRFGRMLGRALVAIFRLGLEGTQWLRGTPFLAALVLLAAIVLVLALLRRRLKGRGKTAR